jgi:CubicO group peptidase (beta-lactamase class C family)
MIQDAGEAMAEAVATLSDADRTYVSRADQYLHEWLRQNRFSGAVLVADSGTILLSKGYGMASREHDVFNTPQTRFRIDSITKQFTAAVILLLEEKGALGLEDLISKYLDIPERWRSVTIHHLLTHTSGIPPFVHSAASGSGAQIPLCRMLRQMDSKPLESDPGSKFVYSDSGYALLGCIIEEVSQSRYCDFLQKNVFDPLQLHNTGRDSWTEIIQHRAIGYDTDGGRVTRSYYKEITGEGFSGLYSTVEDMYVWSQALGSGRLLNVNSFERMCMPFKGNYGYGCFIERRNGHKMIAHGGGSSGFNSFLCRFPDDGLTIVALANLSAQSTVRISTDLAKMRFGEPFEFPQERPVAEIETSMYDQYAGRYELAPGADVIVSVEQGKLFGRYGGQKVELYPESQTKFFSRIATVEVEFVKSESGEISSLLLHDNGCTITARRRDSNSE